MYSRLASTAPIRWILTPGAERTNLYDLAKGGAVIGREHFLGLAAFDGSGERLLASDYPMSVRVVDEGRGIVMHDREHNLIHFDLANRASRRINRPLVGDEQVSRFSHPTVACSRTRSSTSCPAMFGPSSSDSLTSPNPTATA